MKGKRVIHIVGSDCRPEDEEKFERWLNEIHIPLLMKFKGLKKATLHKRMYENNEYPKYFATYEFENKKAFEDYEASPELKVALKERDEVTWKDGKFDITWRVQYELILEK